MFDSLFQTIKLLQLPWDVKDGSDDVSLNIVVVQCWMILMLSIIVLFVVFCCYHMKNQNKDEDVEAMIVPC